MIITVTFDDRTIILDSTTPTLKKLEEAYIQFIYEQTGYNKTRTALILGIDRRTLYRKGYL